MAITKEEVLNKLDINVQVPKMEVVRRVSFFEDGVEITRDHTETLYTFKNEEHIVSESQLVQDIWALISGSDFVS